MRRTLPLIAILAASLALPAGALGAAGHNQPTRKLEAAFKVAQFERAHSPDGCYPAPQALVAKLRDAGQRADTASGTGGVNRGGIVFVLKRGASCGHLEMGFRAGRALWTLDSTEGTVEQKGQGGGKSNQRDIAAGGKGPLRAISLRTKELRLTKADETLRGEVLCPKGKFPLGGGMTSSPAVAADGEGVYPHSYERLGAQRGWHVNPTLFDPKVIANPTNPGTKPHSATLQVVCGKGLVAASGPRRTIFLRSGQAGTVKVRCPGGQQLIAGGFQRTNFRSTGGSYVTESRAIGSKVWQVSGAAFGGVGGDLTAIAYCDKSKRPLFQEVTGTGSVMASQPGSATTAPCPGGRRLTSTGFTFNGASQVLYAGSSINPDGTSTATGFGFFGPAPTLTAYGYCLRPGS